jgi:hypothetical protein
MVKGFLRRKTKMLKITRWRYDDPYFSQSTNTKKRILRKPDSQRKARLNLQMMILSRKLKSDITQL